MIAKRTTGNQREKKSCDSSSIPLAVLAQGWKASRNPSRNDRISCTSCRRFFGMAAEYKLESVGRNKKEIGKVIIVRIEDVIMRVIPIERGRKIPMNSEMLAEIVMPAEFFTTGGFRAFMS